VVAALNAHGISLQDLLNLINQTTPLPPPAITHAHSQQWRACVLMAMMMIMIMANDNLQIVETIGWMRIYM